MILKLIFRFIHVICGCFVIGNAVSDLFWGSRDETGYIVTHITCGIALLVSGVLNIILLQPSKLFSEEDKRTWSILVYSKLGLWLLFLHIPEAIADASGHSFPRKEFNFILVIAVLMVSVIAKTFRDANSRKDEDILKLSE